MAQRVTAWISVVAAVWALGACGKAEGGASGPIAKQDFPDRFGDVYCNSFFGCCQSFDTAACKTRYEAQVAEFLNEASGRVMYDAQAAGDCLSAAQSQIKCGRIEDEDLPACERIFRGTVALGAPCDDSDECAPVSGKRVRCDVPGSDFTAQTVCTVPAESPARHGKPGEACAYTCSESSDCSSVSAPAPGPAPGVPAPEPIEAAVCYRSEGLFCSMGLCARLVALGEACNDYDACAGNTAFCAFDTGVCEAPRANGQPCQSDDDCKSRSCFEEDPAPDGSVMATCSDRVLSDAQCASILEDPSVEEPQPVEPQPVGDPAPMPGTQ